MNAGLASLANDHGAWVAHCSPIHESAVVALVLMTVLGIAGLLRGLVQGRRGNE